MPFIPIVVNRHPLPTSMSILILCPPPLKLPSKVLTPNLFIGSSILFINLKYLPVKVFDKSKLSANS